MIVDDHAAVREGIRAMLESEPDLDPIATAATARDAESLVLATRPDVMVLDHHLPDVDGLSLCLRLESAEPAPAVLMYTAFADEHFTPLAMIAGADAVIGKAVDPEVLCDTVRLLGNGATCLPAIPPAAMARAAARLDPEDLPIFGMLAHATSAAAIAATLQTDERWLAARRWAMLERLTGGAARRRSPGFSRLAL
jgi:DNA-binding NarL/FixJ family response regulator